ncbi:MAG: phosphoribosyltransferase [Halanaeroarchaeum sp.]
MFDDRHDAGRRLAERLRAEEVSVNLVLAIPRGGLPVGREVADAFEVPLDVVAAKKIGAPHNPELAIGAVAADGSVWRNDDLIRQLGVDEAYVETEGDRSKSVAEDKERTYRSGRDPPDLSDRHVAVVDDGVATGATMRACLRAVRERGAASVVVAVPVGAAGTVEQLRAEADVVVVVDAPVSFGAVGAHYRNFSQVSDEEAMAYLETER